MESAEGNYSVSINEAIDGKFNNQESVDSNRKTIDFFLEGIVSIDSQKLDILKSSNVEEYNQLRSNIQEIRLRFKSLPDFIFNTNRNVDIFDESKQYNMF